MAQNAMKPVARAAAPADTSPRGPPLDRARSTSSQAAAQKGRRKQIADWLAGLACGLSRQASSGHVADPPADTDGQTRHETDAATSQGPSLLSPNPPGARPGDPAGNRPISVGSPSIQAADPERRGSVSGQSLGSTGIPTTVSGSSAWSKRLSAPDTALVYLVKVGRQSRWVGRARECPVPPEALAALTQPLEQRIRVDLQNFERERNGGDGSLAHTFSNFPDSIQVLLEMSGVTDKRDNSITLYPSIRIECADHRRLVMMQAVRRAVRWLPETDFRYIRVANKQTTGARDGRNAEAFAVVSRETAGLLDSLEVEFHVGYLGTTPGHESSQLSLTRLLRPTVCRTTLYRNGKRIEARYSRIGGPLVVGGHQVYFTTAHQIFDMILSEEFVPLDGSSCHGGEDTDTQPGSDSRSVADGSPAAPSEDEYRCLTLPAIDFSQVQEWTRVTLPFGTSYGRLQVLSAKEGRSRLVPSRSDRAVPDCAILHVEPQVQPGPVPSLTPGVDVGAAEQKVKILLDGDKVVEGYTCVQASRLQLQKNETPTVLLSLLVALPPGSSGAWVEREDGRFCGMIVASYQDEPMAHMIESRRLVDYVRRAMLDLADTAKPAHASHPGRRLMLLAREAMGLHRRGSHDSNPPGRSREEQEPSFGGVGSLTGTSTVEPTSTQMQAWSEGVSNSNEGEVKAALQSLETMDLASLRKRSRTASSDMGSHPPTSPWIQRLRPASISRRGSAGQGSVTQAEQLVEDPREASADEGARVDVAQDETAVSHAGAHLPVLNEAVATDQIDRVDTISLTPATRRLTGDGTSHSSQRWTSIAGLLVLRGLRRRSSRRRHDRVSS